MSPGLDRELTTRVERKIGYCAFLGLLQDIFHLSGISTLSRKGQLLGSKDHLLSPTLSWQERKWHVTNDPSGFWMDSTNRKKSVREFSLKIEKLFSILEQKYIEVTVSYNQEDRSRDFTSCEMS